MERGWGEVSQCRQMFQEFSLTTVIKSYEKREDAFPIFFNAADTQKIPSAVEGGLGVFALYSMHSDGTGISL